MGGRFSQVKKRDGTVLDSVANVAVFDLVTEEYKPVAPSLRGTGAEVWDMMVYGTGPNADVLIAGKFAGPTCDPVVQLDDAEVGSGCARAWEGLRWGVSLSTFDFAIGKKLWTRSKTTVDPTLRTHVSSTAYRDLEPDADGKTTSAVSACEDIDGKPAKELVKLDTEGNHNASWRTESSPPAVGISLAQIKQVLGWSDYQVRSDHAMRRHWQLVCCAFSFCWLAYGRLPTDEEPAETETPSAEPAGRGIKESSAVLAAGFESSEGGGWSLMSC